MGKLEQTTRSYYLNVTLARFEDHVMECLPPTGNLGHRLDHTVQCNVHTVHSSKSLYPQQWMIICLFLCIGTIIMIRVKHRAAAAIL